MTKRDAAHRDSYVVDGKVHAHTLDIMAIVKYIFHFLAQQNNFAKYFYDGAINMKLP